MLLAALARRALHTFSVASTRAVAAAARARIIRPSAWLADATGVRRARNLVGFGFPVAGRNLDRLRVVHRNHHAVVDLAALGFPNWLAHGVAAGLLFPAWLANGVANLAGLRFPARLANRVGAGLGFPNWLAHGVAASLGFPDWLAHCVANFLAVVFPAWMVDRVATRFGLIARLADRVADLTRLGLPARLANRVAERLRFEARFAYCVANFARALLGHVLHAVNYAVFADPVPNSFVTCELLLLVLDAVHGFHNRVRLHLATRVAAAVPCDTTEPGLGLGWDKRKCQGRG
jgi:hypothetical protein